MVASLVVAAVTAPAFLVVEHRRTHPMLPLELFRSRQFSGANGVTFAVYGALGGALFLLPVELQIVKAYSPLESGVALLPADARHADPLRPLRARCRRGSAPASR